MTTGELLIDGEPPDHPDGLVAMLHKPPGFVCSHDAREGPNVYDLLPARWRARNPTVEAVGRLDKDTTGLLLLTDDGELLHRLTSPKKDVPKTYELEVDADISRMTPRSSPPGELMLTNETKPCAPAKLTVSRDSLRVATLELTEGRFPPGETDDALPRGCTVTRLHRSALMGALTLGRLTEEVRAIDREELERRLVDDAQDT